jgi:RNA polymerase sigma-70 factor (ECF subfamily)
MKTLATPDPIFPDEKILHLIANRNEEGFSLLYKRYWHKLVAYASAFVEDRYTAEEIVQNILVNFYTSDLALSKTGSLASYLCRAVRNRAMNHHRDAGNHNRHILAQCRKDSVSSDSVVECLYMSDLQREIRRCLAKLPERYAEVFSLNRMQAMSIKEVSRQLNRPEGTVEKQLRKVLEYLKANLDIRVFLPA